MDCPSTRRLEEYFSVSCISTYKRLEAVCRMLLIRTPVTHTQPQEDQSVAVEVDEDGVQDDVEEDEVDKKEETCSSLHGGMIMVVSCASQELCCVFVTIWRYQEQSY